MSAPVHIMLHVPKCAGTTAELHFRTHLGESAFCSPLRRRSVVPTELLHRKFDDAPLARAGAQAELRVVSGHFIGRSVLDRFAGRQTLCTVILRDPVKLQLSWYNYRMMRYLAKGQAPYGLETHLRSLPPDPVTHFLLERWLELSWFQIARLSPDRKMAMLDAELASFAEVRDIGQADGLIDRIARDVGAPGTAERHNTAEGWQQIADWQPLTLASISQDLRDLLERRTVLDRYFWERWALGDADARPRDVPEHFLWSELQRPLHEMRRRRARSA